MFVCDTNLAVLQALADRAGAVGEWTAAGGVLRDLRRNQRFSGRLGEQLFADAMESLVRGRLVQVRYTRDVAYVAMTPGCLTVEELRMADMAH